MSVKILALESSCDETSASVFKDGKVFNNIIATQDIHKEYGGVVPELASRAHQQTIIPVVDKALKDAALKPTALDAIAFTRGPGLLGSLLVGTCFAKSMAFALDIPLIAIHHMKAHIFSNFIEEPKPIFPFICLTVSGGHTQLVIVKGYTNMEVIGQTKDDAVGEAFDKAAKMLGLPYPGGVEIDKYAQLGDPTRFSFPISSMPNFDYSFSGIKTAILYFLRDKLKENPDFIKSNLKDIAAGIQHSLVKTLINKLEKASEKYNIKEIAIAGGVSANSGLRKALEQMKIKKKWNIYIPDFPYCGDNAAMIAVTASFKLKEKKFTGLEVSPLARMPI